MKSDLLRMDYINGLPQPFIGRQLGGWEWPIYEICVETGCITMDVCGKLQPTHIGEFTAFIDASGVVHSADDFYNEEEKWKT